MRCMKNVVADQKFSDVHDEVFSKKCFKCKCTVVSIVNRDVILFELAVP